MLKKFIGDRASGLLFRSKNGLPLLQSNVLRLSLHPLLKRLQLPKSGAHAFRRFRATWLIQQVEGGRDISQKGRRTGRDRVWTSNWKARSCTLLHPHRVVVTCCV